LIERELVDAFHIPLRIAQLTTGKYITSADVIGYNRKYKIAEAGREGAHHAGVNKG
jgi:hypothetical protein